MSGVRVVRNGPDVPELLELWAELGRIRERLLGRVQQALADRERVADDLAELHKADAAVPAQKLMELVEGERAAAAAALDDFDAALRARLKRAHPPWDVATRFADTAVPGIPYERQVAFGRAVDVLRPLTEHRRVRLRAEGWRPGARLPPAIDANPTTKGFEWLGVAGSSLMRADELQRRFRGEPVRERALADACRFIVRELQGETVANILFGVAKGHGASTKNAAALIVANYVGLDSAFAVLNAMKGTRAKGRGPGTL